MSEECIRIDNPTVLTPEERIRELQDEVADLRGWKKNPAALEKLVANPEALKGLLGLTSAQAENVAAILTGGGAALSRKYLTQALGPALAGAIGGLLGGVISSKLLKT